MERIDGAHWTILRYDCNNNPRMRHVQATDKIGIQKVTIEQVVDHNKAVQFAATGF